VHVKFLFKAQNVEIVTFLRVNKNRFCVCPFECKWAATSVTEGRSFNRLCPFTSHKHALEISKLSAFYVPTVVRQWWSDTRRSDM